MSVWFTHPGMEWFLSPHLLLAGSYATIAEKVNYAKTRKEEEKMAFLLKHETKSNLSGISNSAAPL